MPIQLNYLNPQGLATLAGQNVGNMNLPVVGLQPGLFQQNLVEAANKKDMLRLQNSQLQQQMLLAQLKEQGLNEREAQKALNQYNLQQYKDSQAMNRVLAQEQGSMGRQMMQTQLGYDQLGSLNEYRNAGLGLDQAKLQETIRSNNNNLAMQQQQQALDEYKVHLQEQMKLGEQKVSQRASFMASVVKNAPKTDDEGALDEYYRNAMTYGVKTGAFTQEEANQFVSVPANMKKTLAEASVSMSNTAVNYLKESKSSLAKSIEEANTARKAAGQQPLTSNEEAQIYSQYAFNLPKKGVQLENKLQEKIYEKDANMVEEASKIRFSVPSMRIDIQDAIKQLPNIPDFAVGPIPKAVGLDKLSPEAQKLIQPLNGIALQLKEYYKLGSGQGFTDADRNFLTEIAGNTGYYKSSLGDILARLNRISTAAEYNAWKKEDEIRSRGNKEDYQQWSKGNPQPQAPNSYAQEDLEYTAKKYNMSVEDVKKKLGM